MRIAPGCILTLLLALGLACVACGKVEPTASPIRVGEPKEVLLDRLGVPNSDVVSKNGQLTTLGYSSDPMAYYRRQQPADEVWFWTYKDDGTYTIQDGKVWATPATTTAKPDEVDK